MNESMSKLKGLIEFIEAAKYFPNYTFYIVGKGDYLQKIKKTSPKNVIFTGPLFGKKLHDMFSKSLIYCNLSLSEGFGLTVAEAMASGCAIVSTIDIGQAGLFVNPKDVRGLEKAISYLVNNPKEIDRMVSINKNLAKNYTWDNFVEGFQKVYKTLI